MRILFIIWSLVVSIVLIVDSYSTEIDYKELYMKEKEIRLNSNMSLLKCKASIVTSELNSTRAILKNIKEEKKVTKEKEDKENAGTKDSDS